MALPVAFKDELVARSDIVDVVSDYVTLTPKGGSFWGLCPFHGEKTPSFHVLPDRQLYHCFGCGKGGGVISFVMDVENLPYIDAVRLLAKRAGMEVPEDGMDQVRQRQRSRLLALNKEAARFFHSQLHSPVGQGGLQYLQNRGLSRGTMTRFGLGFAPDSWDSLIRAMAQKGFEKRDLLDAGLAVSNKKGGIYDRFRGRVMFPIIDLRGDVIGFGGRVLGDGTPKYLNSPDTPVFNKSRNLFALNLAKNTKQGRLLLTEGYMDTISLRGLQECGGHCKNSPKLRRGQPGDLPHRRPCQAPVPVYQGGYPLLRRGHGGGPSGQPGHPHAGKNGPEGAGPSDHRGQRPGRVYQNLWPGGLRQAVGPVGKLCSV